jgi:uncharacterized protein YjbI with pentapeptide repeats
MARTSKPHCIGILPNPLRIAGQSFMSYGVTIAFPLQEEKILLAEQDTWLLLAPYLPQISFLDSGAPKVKGEWLLAGHSYAPHEAQKTWESQVRIGNAYKTLRVHGPRQWLNESITDAKPVKSVAINWNSTWGGAFINDNKFGCGVRVENGEVRVPSIEDPDYPWKNPDEKCRPSCTLPIDVMHHRRQAFAGTYGNDYLERYFPGMPADFDKRYFNMAPLDQQIEGFWHGNENYSLKHWHPEIPVINGQLPCVRPALHVGRKGAPLQRIDTPLTTVWMFPEVLLGVIVFHGSVSSSTLDGSEFDRIIAGVESLDSPFLPQEHYEELWTSRTERTVKAVARALDDEPMCPPGFKTRFTKMEEALSRVRPNPGLEKMGERMANKWEEAASSIDDAREASEFITNQFPDIKEQMTKNTIDDNILKNDLKQLFLKYAEAARNDRLDIHGKKFHEQIDEIEKNLNSGNNFFKITEEFKDSILEKISATYNASKEKLDENAFNILDSNKIEQVLESKNLSALLDIESLPNQAESKEYLSKLDPQTIRDGIKSLEKFSQTNDFNQGESNPFENTQVHINKLKDFIESRGDEHADGAQRIIEEIKAYSSIPVKMPDFKPLPADGDFMTYAKDFLANAEPPKFEKLIDEDLSEPDQKCIPGVRMYRRTIGQKRFRNLDMRGAEFEEITFIGCDFSGCNLSESTWRKCVCIGCDLNGAIMENALIHDLMIQWSCFDNLKASGSSWNLTKALYSSYCSADFKNSAWSHSVMMNVDWSDSNWQTSKLKCFITMHSKFGLANFTEINAEQSMWSSSELAESTWNKAVLSRCNLYDSKLPRQWNKSKLTHVCLRGSELLDGNWQGAEFDGVDFSECILVSSDFSEMTSKGLFMIGSDLRESNFSNTKIENGIFTSSDIRGARFIGSSLHHCWFGLSHQNDETDFAGANLLSCNFYPKNDEGKK